MSSNAGTKNRYKKNKKKPNASAPSGPKVVHVRPIRQEKKARELAKAEGIRGSDPRISTPEKDSGLKDMVVPGSDVSIDVVVPYDIKSVQALCLGIILDGYRRGWQSTSDYGYSNVYPYFAYVKLYQAFTTAMLGGEQTLQSAPKWYWHMVNALQPKTLPYKTGSVTYKWNVPDGEAFAVPSYDFDILGKTLRISGTDPNQPEVNGFFTVVIPPNYDPTAADNALKSLFALYKDEGLCSQVPVMTTNMVRDSSAFSVCGAEYGSASSNGGIVSTLYSEREIKSPIFAKFGTYQQGQYFRGWDRVQRSGGTPFYILPRMVEMSYSSQLKNKLPPQFLFYNFDEFYETLALTVGKAMEIQVETQIGAPIPTCPLSPLEVQLLLRHTLMRRFANHLAQDMLISETPNLLLIPFSTAANGLSLTPTAMLLPQFLAENIRACSRRSFQLGKNENQRIDFVPILSRPFDFPQLGNYTTTGGQSVFTDKPGETPIDLVDLSYQMQQPGQLGYISTEGDQIMELCTEWNQWVKTISGTLSPLTDPALEQGINLLATVLLTAQQSYSPPDAAPINSAPKLAKLDKVPSKKNLGTPKRTPKKLGASPVANSSYFEQIQVSQIYSNVPLLTPAFKFQKVMIIPVAMSYGQPVGAATASARQIFQLQPFRTPVTAFPTQLGVPGGASALIKHQVMAAMDTKAPLAAESDIQTELRALTEMGEGGLFTSLAGLFAEDFLGIKGGKQIAGAIGEATGW